MMQLSVTMYIIRYSLVLHIPNVPVWHSAVYVFGVYIERFHIHSNENEHKNNHGYIAKSAILLNQFQCASALKLWWKVQKRRKTLISSNFSVVNMENTYYTKKEITYMMRTFTFKETSETPIQRSIGWFNNMA